MKGVNGITDEIARAIVAYRGRNQFQSIADLLDVTANQNQNQNQSQGQQPNRQPGQNNQGSGGPRVISEDLFIEIADKLSNETVEEQPGLVNINSAGVTVLACLPGINSDLAQAIIGYRASNGFFPNIAHLLRVPGFTREIFKQVAGRVTARSETFRIVSEGKINSSGTRQRLQVIVHVGSDQVKTLSYREDL